MKAQRKKKRDLPVSFPEVSFQRQALVLNAMPFERWLELGKVLGQIEGAVQFWIGDYLNSGKRAYGEKYSQAVEAKEADRWTHYAWVARSVPEILRKHILSYKHHEAVAPLETTAEQTKWLDEAVKNKWTVHELRQRIRLFREPPPKLDFHDTSDGPAIAPEVEAKFEMNVKPQRYYLEIPKKIGDLAVSSEKLSADGDFKHLIDLVRALRTAVRGGLVEGVKS